MKLSSDNVVQLVLVAVAVVLVGYLVLNYLNQDEVVQPEVMPENMPNVVENFYTDEQEGEDVVQDMEPDVVDPSEPLGQNEEPKSLGDVESTSMNQLPAECYPKDVLSSADLLPRDANSKWAQAAPSGQGSLQDKNFLTAGFHIGVNTVGQTLRNANRQLRSDPPNPAVKVSPWNQTTIEADTNRRAMEIGA